MSRGFKVLSSLFTVLLIAIVAAIAISVINDFAPETYTVGFYHEDEAVGFVEKKVGETLSKGEVTQIESRIEVDETEYLVWSASKDQVTEVDLYSIQSDTNVYAVILKQEYKVNVSGNIEFDYDIISDGKIVSGSIVYLQLNNLGSFVPTVKIGESELVDLGGYKYLIQIDKSDVNVDVTLVEHLTIVPVVDESYVYDGNRKEVYYSLYDGNNSFISDVEIKYYRDGAEVSEIKNAGTYKVLYHYTGDKYVVEDVEKEIVVQKATYDMSGVTFTDATYTYDGTEKELVISGTLPNGLTVSYSANKLTNAGSLEVTATFNGDFDNYNTVEPMKATLKVNKATYDVSGVTFADATYTYDGTEKELVISGTLPNGLTVSYSPNKLTNAGTLEVTATFNGDFDNYNAVEPMKATLTVNKATYNMNGVTFTDATYTYDGTEKELVISGTLPNGLTVSYSPNKLTNVGSLEVTATFNGDFDNYNAVESMKATLKVNKATYNMSGVTFVDAIYDYDGTEKELVISGTLPNGLTVSYSPNKLTNAGSLEVTATFNGDFDNYNPVESMKATLKILKATITVVGKNYQVFVGEGISGINFEVTFVGLKGNDTAEVIKGTPVYQCAVTETSPVGKYPIIVEGFESDNYGFNYEWGYVEVVSEGYIIKVEDSDLTKVYNGQNQMFTAKLVSKDGVIDGIEFKYEDMMGNPFTGATNVGHYRVLVSYDDPTYGSGSIEAVFNITKATYDMSGVTFADATYTYDGTEKALEITGTLPNGVTVSYSANKLTNVDSIEVVATFTGDSDNYYLIPTMKATLEITQKELTSNMFDSLDDESYTSKEIKPEVHGTFNQMNLVLGRDYNVTYSNNVNPGTASITVEGIGNYKGQVTLTFEIKLSDLSKAILDLEEILNKYDGTLVDKVFTTATYGSRIYYTPESTTLVIDEEGNVSVEYKETEQLITVYVTVRLNDAVTYGEIVFTVPERIKAQFIDMSISELAALTKDSKVVTDRYIAEVSGVVSGLYNTEYGNFYLTDPETKAQILVYGIVKANAEKFKYSDDTLGHYIADVIFVKDGEDKYISNDKSFASLGISEGDYITIRAMVITYNGKAQLQGEFVSLDENFTNDNKVEVEFVDENVENIGTVTGIKEQYALKEKVTFTVTPKEGYFVKSVKLLQGFDTNNYTENGTLLTIENGEYSFTANVINKVVVEFTTEEVGEAEFIKDVSIKELSNFTAASNLGYEVSGIVANIGNTTYGNFDLYDPLTGDKIYVYGLCKESDSVIKWTDNLDGTYVGGTFANDKSFSSLGVKVGDYITVRAIVAMYNNKSQLNATLVSITTEYTPIVNVIYDETQGTVNKTVQNGKITLTVSPLEGFELVSVKVNQDCGNVYTSVEATDGVYSIDAKYYNSIKVEFSEIGAEPTESSWDLVENVSDLQVGDKIVIVASASDVALSTNQKSNNRGQAAVSKSGNSVEINDEVEVITLEAGTKANTFAFNVGSGKYLYAASSSSNYLRTGNKDDNASWLITIAGGIATIKAQGTYTRNWLRYNSSSSLFACYASGQGDVSIYKYIERTTTPTEPTDLEKVNQDKQQLNIETNITNSITLPSSGANGSTITWVSDNEDVIKIASGVATVTQQAVETVVKLTATLKLNDATATKEFSVTVAKLEEVTPPIVEGLFKDGEEVLIAAIRSSGNYLIMVADVGTASTKRYQLVDSGTQNPNELVNFDVTNENQVWKIRYDGTDYYLEAYNGLKANWSSGNSGILDATGAKLVITKNDDGTYKIAIKGNSENRALELNSSAESNYFAFYKGTQIGELQIIKLSSSQTEVTDQDKVNQDKESLSIETTITDSITLPSSGTNGSTITWASSNGNVINPQTGTVTQQAEITTVTLTATLKLNDATATKEFVVTVKALLTDYDKVQLDIEEIRSKLPVGISSNTVLPEPTYSQILWESGNTDVLRINNGTLEVTRTGNDETVTLIALFELGAASEIVEYEIIVYGETIDSYQKLSDVSELTNNLEIIITNQSTEFALGSVVDNIGTKVEFDETNVSDEVLIITLEEVSDGKFYLKTKDGNLYKSSEKKLFVGNETSTKAQWTFSIDDKGYFKIQNVGDSEWYLQYNVSSPRFVCYKGTQQNVVIYSKNAVEKTPQDIVEFDINAFSLPASVMHGYYLPTNGKYGSTITWTPDNEFLDYYSNGMLVNETDDKIKVKLYAKFKYGDYESEKIEYNVELLNSNFADNSFDYGTYYDGINAQSGRDLLLELRTLTTSTHTYVTSYDDLKDYLPDADQDLENPGNMILFYTGESIKKKYDCTTWNREHVWCQSLAEGWFKTSGAGADMHHIRPCNSSVNSSRGNTPFGVGSGYYTPTDEYKGDVARIIFYLLTRYEKADDYSVTVIAQSMDMLLEWNDLDPVSNHEAYRNDYISDIQGNRNPFIDNSDYADMIWG